jgi:hypothetical protein
MKFETLDLCHSTHGSAADYSGHNCAASSVALSAGFEQHPMRKAGVRDALHNMARAMHEDDKETPQRNLEDGRT